MITVLGVIVAAFAMTTVASASTLESRQTQSCPSAFGTLLEMHDAHDATPYAGITERDLRTLAQWTADLHLSAALVFSRFEKLRALEHDMMLTLNNRELARLAVLTAPYPYASVEHYFKTLIVQTRVQSGGRRIKVPNRIHARLTALALLSNKLPGSLAEDFNDNFIRVLDSEKAMRAESELVAVTLEPPVDLALRRTIRAWPIAATTVGLLLLQD